MKIIMRWKRVWMLAVAIPLSIACVWYLLLPRQTELKLSADEQQWLKDHSSIRVAPNPFFAPYDFFDADGSYDGLSADLFKIFERKLGISWVIVRYDVREERWNAIRNKIVDIIPTLRITPDRLTYLQFTKPITVTQNVIVVNTRYPQSFTIDSLNGRQVAVPAGGPVHEELRKNFPGVIPIPVVSGNQSLYEVAFGRADAAIVSVGSASFFIQQHGIPNLRVSGNFQERVLLSIGIRSDWPLLRSILDKTLESIPQEERDRLNAKWLGLKYHAPWWEMIPWQWIAAVIGILFAVTVGIVLWNRILQRVVRMRTEELLRELNERRTIEDQLRISEEKFRRMFDLSPVGAVMVGLDRKFIRCNDAFCRFLGYSEQELLGRLVQEVVYAEDSHIGTSEIEEILNGTRDRCRVEKRYVRKDGKIVWAEETIGLMRSEDKTPLYFLPVVQDITEQKLLAQQLAESHKMESLGTLAGGVAHDFNNILNIIVGYSDRMLQNAEGTERRSLEIILKAADRATELVRQILTFARRTQFQSVPLSVNAIVKELAAMLYETFPRTIEVDTNLDPHLPQILGDKTQIHQAILNLAVNARDAMPFGGRLIFSTESIHRHQIRERFPDAEGNHYVLLKVRDTGTGMDPTIVQRIFEPFFTTKEHGKGTGLGLSVVYGIVKGLKGYVNVESVKDQGTSFFLFLPIFENGGAQDLTDAGRQETAGGSETILVVEDEDGSREILEEALLASGYRVVSAKDGDAALELFRAQSGEIDLVISDLGLPRMNGFECFKKMKEICPDILFILASGFIDPNERASMEKEGIRCFIQKPFYPQTALQLIRKNLDDQDS